jgi:hypothetical protein
VGPSTTSKIIHSILVHDTSVTSEGRIYQCITRTQQWLCDGFSTVIPDRTVSLISISKECFKHYLISYVAFKSHGKRRSCDVTKPLAELKAILLFWLTVAVCLPNLSLVESLLLPVSVAPIGYHLLITGMSLQQRDVADSSRNILRPVHSKRWLHRYGPLWMQRVYDLYILFKGTCQRPLRHVNPLKQ